mmetsp:Transcript_28621/g.48331  ORF Transcript_28621/g.48331 Transcript_28621/m.48331 type:complete len:183 (+) Transcript_28621:55-603(+)|eukprot:CAMPEP_0114413974 /NCGR_PEP_ID=MMETSP0103-20121206/1143_1 /TAXON_ID=37642 ORGANISM="Paraphysomonas imperforata, Strain PA2" /NCGR_SAMPLE_ID=MMETSP0103 /ASSEMBLY_ACC=CAM_ASM_000201 /LENGTH=182 /DNA_ID=CAMNT_0001582089 /DNA_START=49 /DNA_END=597 /DNA_ORIENTATION=-
MSDEKGGDSKLYVESKGIYSDEKPSRSEGKEDFDHDAKAEYLDDGKLKTDFEYPVVDVTSLTIEPRRGPVDGPLELAISFTLDRDVVAGYWEVKFLVDAASSRVIKVLGRTKVEDYPEGESEMNFDTDAVDISGISPSTLTNSGLLMACFMVHGEEVAAVNMVVNVTNNDGDIRREVLSPLE